jgi:hypothetical protein
MGDSSLPPISLPPQNHANKLSKNRIQKPC